MKETYPGILMHQMKQVSIAFAILFTLALTSGIAQQTVSIGLTKMNVLYRMIENPATIAVSGVNQNDIKATIDNGSIRAVDKGYSIIPAHLGKAVVTVNVKDKVVGTVEFRVKDLPSPVAKINGRGSGTVEKAWLLTTEGVSAELEGSEFDYLYKVVSFDVSTIKGQIEISEMSNSDKFTANQMNIIKNVPVDGKVMIEQIKVVGPDGTPRDPLPDIIFKIK